MVTLSALIEEVQAEAPSAQPLDLLATASTKAGEVNDLTDALLSHFVDQCRRAGHSWADIGTSLGVTKQAVQQRFTRDLGEPANWDRFTPRARKVVGGHAEAAAAELGHHYVGTEHLLLAMWGEPKSLGTLVLAELGVQRAQVVDGIRSRVDGESEAGPGDAPGGYTPRAWVAVGNAAATAVRMGHNYVGTEHLLLGLLGGVGGIAEEVLIDLGVDERTVATKVLAHLEAITKGRR